MSIGCCRSESPDSFYPSSLAVQTEGSDIHLFDRFALTCSGNISRVEVFTSFFGSNTWNETLTLKLLFLEAPHESTQALRLVDIISVSVDRMEFISNNNSVHIVTPKLTKHLTIKKVFSRIGLQLPPSRNMSDGDRRVYNHIPVANLHSLNRQCASISDYDNIRNLTGASRLFCHMSTPPVIVTVEDQCNGQETSM